MIFKGKDGNFETSLSEDVKGMLSLYEASCFGYEGEDILDEALAFTTKHLENVKGDIPKRIGKQVSHALELPLNHRVQRLEARWFIEEYSKREDANAVLLELASLDFNMVQSTLQREVQEMSRSDSIQFQRKKRMILASFFLKFD